jgi:anti-sigma regulatory factor (Ser/Thr protein kinase)
VTIVGGRSWVGEEHCRAWTLRVYSSRINGMGIAAMNSPAAPARMSTNLPFGSDAPSIARGHLRSFIKNLPAASRDSAALMVSELVTNAFVHGEPDITLQLSVEGGHLSVAVGDFGEGRVTQAAPSPRESSGRGLVLVDALSARWGVTRTSGHPGKQVWFELD